MKPTMLAIAAFALLPGTLGAQETPRSVRVSHADLDLTTTAGIRTLDRRIDAAAKAVCPDASSTYDLARLAVARRCAAQTADAAKLQRDRVVAASAGLKLAQSAR